MMHRHSSDKAYPSVGHDMTPTYLIALNYIIFQIIIGVVNRVVSGVCVCDA
jgi:hypothetical protein